MRDKDGSLKAMVAMLVNRFGGSQKEFAIAVGISPSALSRAVAQPWRRPPSVEVCFRMATVGRVNAAKVLRAAGYAALVDQIEEHFGPAADQRQRFGDHVTPKELIHLARWRAADPTLVRAFERILEMGFHPRIHPRIDAHKEHA